MVLSYLGRCVSILRIIKDFATEYWYITFDFLWIIPGIPIEIPLPCCVFMLFYREKNKMFHVKHFREILVKTILHTKNERFPERRSLILGILSVISGAFPELQRCIPSDTVWEYRILP